MNLFFSDIKSIARSPVLLCSLLSPVIIALFLLYCFPLFSGSYGSGDVIAYMRYYSLTSITLIFAIPFIYGLLFSIIHLKKLHPPGNMGADSPVRIDKSVLISRMALSSALSFILVLPVIYVTDPVSTEGWLRSVYAAFLLAITAPFIFILAVSFSGGWKKKAVSVLYLLFLITVPAGLLLHHPWSYFIFFSQFYWAAWAWVVVTPAESLVYGMISAVITAILTVKCFRHFIRNSGTD